MKKEIKRKSTTSKTEKALTSLEADRASQPSDASKNTKEDLNKNLSQNTAKSQRNHIIQAVSSPFNGLDLDRLKLTQNFDQCVGVKKLLTIVPVRKPTRQEFVHVHPDPEYHFSAGIIELKEERESFIVDSALWAELPGEIIPKILMTTINRQGVLFLWPIRLPNPDGRIDNWNQSALEAAQFAQNRWIRLAANMSLGGYETFVATGDFPEPEWPDKSMAEILNIAFKDRCIDSLDHPVIKKLRGEI